MRRFVRTFAISTAIALAFLAGWWFPPDYSGISVPVPQAAAQYVRQVVGVAIYNASITPTATAATIGVAVQTFTFTGLNVGDLVAVIAAPTATALCPPVSFLVTAANTVSIGFAVMTALACTPAAGTYVLAAFR